MRGAAATVALGLALALVPGPASAESLVERQWDWKWRTTTCVDGLTTYKLAVTNDTGRTRRLYADWLTPDTEGSMLAILDPGRTAKVRVYLDQVNDRGTLTVRDKAGRVIVKRTNLVGLWCP